MNIRISRCNWKTGMPHGTPERNNYKSENTTLNEELVERE